MTIGEGLNIFSALDYAALAVLVAAWLGIGWWIERPSDTRPSVSQLMEGFRREWMAVMVTRQPRMFDAQLMGILRQGTTFFASGAMLAIGGGLALVGNTERLAGVAADLVDQEVPPQVWEIKMILVLLFLANSFLKYVWAHRLFGYCSVLIASVPNDPGDALCQPRAAQAAEISNTAARSFSRGMRATYFALAALAWLLGPLALAGASVLTAAILWRREFHSRSRVILLKSRPKTQA